MPLRDSTEIPLSGLHGLLGNQDGEKILQWCRTRGVDGGTGSRRGAMGVRAEPRGVPPPGVSGIRASVVIPALNERDTIARALDSTSLPGVERIVVDGGSSDGTAELARSLGAQRVIRATSGRAHQMDAGYREAEGDVIVFLHADTRLDAGWLEAIGAALGDGAVAGGAFRLAFASSRPVYRLLELWVRLRSRFARLPFGDQALFLRRELIDAQGGIRSVPIFEDLDLVRLIRRSGRLALLPEQAWTSTRRYERNGLLRQGLRNHAAVLAWHLGLDRDRVAHWYGRRPTR